MKWETGVFKVQVAGHEPRLEEGLIRGSFGVATTPLGNGWFDVTHLPTGFALPCLFGSVESAQKAAEHLEAADSGWADFTGKGHPEYEKYRQIFRTWAASETFEEVG